MINGSAYLDLGTSTKRKETEKKGNILSGDISEVADRLLKELKKRKTI